MSLDFSGYGYISKNGAKSSLHCEHAIYSGFRRSSYFNLKASHYRMESAKLILAIFTWIGLGSYFAGIFLNINTWKSTVLAFFGFAFILLKFIGLSIRIWQSYKREEIEIKILRKKSEE